jgi:SAM-dependent methyltransferase
MPAGETYPPPPLAHRVQQPISDRASYETLGKAHREAIIERLPEDWTFSGKHILDFGCGPGRLLQHFRPEMEDAEFSGCDIHSASIEWARENLNLPAELIVADPDPPLPLPSGHFDLIWALSVFTHITDNWAAWLCELHRLLSRDGLLLATFHGEGTREILAAEPWNDEWDEDRIGMNVVQPYLSWDEGGPGVFHSRWWLEAHWGRAFEVVEMRPSGFDSSVDEGHGTVLLRKKGRPPTPEELERPQPDEPREYLALQHNIRQLSLEIRALRDERDALLEDRDAVRDDRDRLASDLESGPLRALALAMRQMRGRAAKAVRGR